jgi:hypothetical protein
VVVVVVGSRKIKPQTANRTANENEQTRRRSFTRLGVKVGVRYVTLGYVFWWLVRCEIAVAAMATVYGMFSGAGVRCSVLVSGVASTSTPSEPGEDGTGPS